MARTQRVTLNEIAAQTGLSLTTISKVLNGATDVSSATRALVEEHLRRERVPAQEEQTAARVHRGRPARARGGVGARHPRRRPRERRGGGTRGLPLGERRPPRAGTGVAGVGRAPRADGHHPALRRHPAGRAGELTARGIPFVIIDPAGDPAQDIPSVGSANWSGGLAATRHLLELGHRRIAAITGPDSVMCALARLDGYRAGMSSARVPIAPEWIRFGDFQRDGGERHASELLRLADPPTAIFAGNDAQALGVLHAAAALGWTVPRRPLGGGFRRPGHRRAGPPAADDGPPAPPGDGRTGDPPRAPAAGTSPVRRSPVSSWRHDSWSATRRRGPRHRPEADGHRKRGLPAERLCRQPASMSGYCQ